MDSKEEHIFNALVDISKRSELGVDFLITLHKKAGIKEYTEKEEKFITTHGNMYQIQEAGVKVPHKLSRRYLPGERNEQLVGILLRGNKKADNFVDAYGLKKTIPWLQQWGTPEEFNTFALKYIDPPPDVSWYTQIIRISNWNNSSIPHPFPDKMDEAVIKVIQNHLGDPKEVRDYSTRDVIYCTLEYALKRDLDIRATPFWNNLKEFLNTPGPDRWIGNMYQFHFSKLEQHYLYQNTSPEIRRTLQEL